MVFPLFWPRYTHTHTIEVCMAFERALRHAREIAVSVPHGQVVVMDAPGADREIVTVWVLNRSIEKPYATWGARDNGSTRLIRRHADMHVVEVCGRGGHLIARAHLEKTVYMFSLDGACVGGFKGVANRPLEVVGNCLVEYDLHLFKVYCVHSGPYAVANTVHAVAVFACATAARPFESYRLSPWQQGFKFHVVVKRYDFAFQFPTVVFEADLHRGTFEAYARSGALIRVLQVLQDMPGDKDSLIVYDETNCRIGRVNTTGHLQQWYGYASHMSHWHPSLGCFDCHSSGFRILFTPNEDGGACRAYRMSPARKSWIQACAL